MNILANWQRRQIRTYLEKANPQEIIKEAQKRLLPCFRAASQNVPAYQKILKEKNVKPRLIKDEGTFRQLVPVIDKEIFSLYPLRELCQKAMLEKAKIFSTSSGFSGKFSYSLTTAGELKNLSSLADFLLDYHFHTSAKKTMVISCLAMGVKVYTNLALAEVSVRPDLVLALIDKLSNDFQQFILIGNPLFLKAVLEKAQEEGFNLKSKDIFIVMGEEWFPENLRSYLLGLLGRDSKESGDRLIIGSNMGICELGLSLFRESRETINIRRKASEDEKFRAALFGEDATACPILFQYNPFQIFLEEIDNSLVFSTLSKDALIPLMRYDSKDKGRIISYERLKEILREFNYERYLPKMHLPLVAVEGRKDKFLEVKERRIYPEEIKESLCSDFQMASATTGYFRMGKESGQLKIEIQLKEDKAPSEELKRKFKAAIARFAPEDFNLTLYPYKDFPYGMGLIYEQKFKYI